MIGDSGTSRSGAKHYYYTCSTRKRGGDCKKKSVRAKAIEDEVINATIQVVLQDDMLEHIADRVMEYQAKDTDGAALIEQYRGELKETETAISRYPAGHRGGYVHPVHEGTHGGIGRSESRITGRYRARTDKPPDGIKG